MQYRWGMWLQNLQLVLTECQTAVEKILLKNQGYCIPNMSLKLQIDSLYK